MAISRRVPILTVIVFVLLGIATGIVALVTSAKSDPGEVLYVKHCQSCHLEEGQGLGKLIPPLAGSDWLADHQYQLACIIRYGQYDSIIVNGQGYYEKMPGNETLSDGQILNIINHINSSWGNDIPEQQLIDVSEALEDCSDWEYVEQ